MMQLTEMPPPPPRLPPSTLPCSLEYDTGTMTHKTSQIQRITSTTPLCHQSSSSSSSSLLCSSFLNFPTLSKWSLQHQQGSSSRWGWGDAKCMEELLVHCAKAIVNNDATPAHQILWVLNTIAPPDGNSTQRLTCAFLLSLLHRAAAASIPTPTTSILSNTTATCTSTHRFSVIELANYVDLTPWHRFGFTAANSMIVDAVEGYSVVHIVDATLTHCMQIPTLIEALAARPEGPPLLLKLTVPALSSHPIPPLLSYTDLLHSYQELGSKLVHFARSKNMALDFKAIPCSCSDGFSSLIEDIRFRHLEGEALVFNCHMMLHLLPSNSTTNTKCKFLEGVRGLNPVMVIVVDEDADLTSTNLVTRLRSTFNYMWIPFDIMDTLLPRGSKQREWYEADMCWKIENVITHDDGPNTNRVEMQEPLPSCIRCIAEAGFKGVAFTEEAVAEVKSMLEEHGAPGWGSKRDQLALLLTWKGHNVVFATAWIPTAAAAAASFLIPP